MRMVEAISKVVIHPRCGAWCREMLADPLQGNGGGMHGIASRGRGGDHISTRGRPKRTRVAEIGGGARTSHFQGRGLRRGEHGEGGSSS